MQHNFLKSQLSSDDQNSTQKCDTRLGLVAPPAPKLRAQTKFNLSIENDRFEKLSCISDKNLSKKVGPVMTTANFAPPSQLEKNMTGGIPA